MAPRKECIPGAALHLYQHWSGWLLGSLNLQADASACQAGPQCCRGVCRQRCGAPAATSLFGSSGRCPMLEHPACSTALPAPMPSLYESQDLAGGALLGSSCLQHRPRHCRVMDAPPVPVRCRRCWWPGRCHPHPRLQPVPSLQPMLAQDVAAWRGPPGGSHAAGHPLHGLALLIGPGALPVPRGRGPLSPGASRYFSTVDSGSAGTGAREREGR